VTSLMHVERYSHVLHLAARSRRPAGRASALDVFRATFPAGRGPARRRCGRMQIIDEWSRARGPYAGAAGYIAAGDRRMDLAITSAPASWPRRRASVQAGRRDRRRLRPEREWEETENKARAMHTAHRPVRARRRPRRQTDHRAASIPAWRLCPALVDPVRHPRSLARRRRALVVGRSRSARARPVRTRRSSRRAHAELERAQ
jgi:hypothetical protein